MATTGMVDPSKGMEKSVPYIGREIKASRPQVSSYTFTGPTSGSNGVASTNFTVALPSNQIAPYGVTVTPADAGTGNAGVFTPASVRLTDEYRSATFTYTPGSTGVKTISVTNAVDGSSTLMRSDLTNPASIAYTSS